MTSDLAGEVAAVTGVSAGRFDVQVLLSRLSRRQATPSNEPSAITAPIPTVGCGWRHGAVLGEIDESLPIESAHCSSRRKSYQAGSTSCCMGPLLTLYGDGEPLLLVHGLGGSWRTGTPILDDLPAEREVNAVDSPGRGETPGLVVIGWGHRDRVTLPRQGTCPMEQFPEADVHWLEESGYYPPWAEPAATTELILSRTGTAA